MNRITTATIVLFFLGGLYTLVGLLGFSGQLQTIKGGELNLFTLILGLIYIGLGYLIKTRNSAPALLIATMLIFLDAIFIVVMSMKQSVPFPYGPVFVRIILLLPMVRAFLFLRNNS